MKRFTFGSEFNRHPPQVCIKCQEACMLMKINHEVEINHANLQTSSLNLLGGERKRRQYRQEEHYFDLHLSLVKYTRYGSCSYIVRPRMDCKVSLYSGN